MSGVFADGYARRALMEALLVGALCGVVGVHVVLRRLSFFTMAMTHATFPGVVLASLVGVDLLLGSGAFGVLVVLGVAALSARPHSDSSAAVGVVLSAGFALGVVLLSARSGFSRDLSAYLVGSILTVQWGDLITTAVVLVVVLAVLAAVGKELVLGAFDPVGLVALGYPARWLGILMLLLVEVAVVTTVPAVGTIQAVALVVAPAASARLWCERIGTMTALSAGLGMASGVVGVAVSQQASVAAGAAIVLAACGFFLVSVLFAPRHGALARWRGRPRTTVVARPALDEHARRPPAGRPRGTLRRAPSTSGPVQRSERWPTPRAFPAPCAPPGRRRRSARR